VSVHAAILAIMSLGSPMWWGFFLAVNSGAFFLANTAGIDQCSIQKHAQNIENTKIKLPNKVIISMFLIIVICFMPVPGQNIGHCLQ
jgi:hypothetical protein